MLTREGVVDAAETPLIGHETDVTELSLEELGAIKVPLVFGASKHDQKVTEAPSSVSIVTSDEIKKFGHRTLADVLQSVRGFYIGYDRTYSYVGVRGFNRPGDFGGRTLILIDGHRLNEPIFDSSAVDTDFLLDVDLIDRVEVVRGPGSVLYGNNAFFSVINVITRRGREMNGGEAAAAVASYDSYKGRLSYGKQFTNGVELLFSGSYYDRSGPESIYVREFDTPEQNDGIADHFDRDEFYSTFASVSYRGLTLEGGYVSRKKDSPLVPYQTLFNDRRQHPIDNRGFAALGWEGKVGDDWDVTTRAYYDVYTLAVDYPYDAADDGDPPAIVLNRERDAAQWTGIEGQVSRMFWDRHRLTVGTEVRHDFSLRIKSYDISPYDLVGNIRDDATRVGAFAQGEFQLLTNLILNAGLRYDYYTSFGQTLNPRAGVIYSPWSETTFKFLYGQAYRAPNLWEYAFESPFQKPNMSLNAETIRSYELVYEQYLPAEFRFSLSGFLNQTRDLIVQTVDPGDDLIVFQNVDRTETKGFEMEVEHASKSGLLARASYSLQRTEEKETGEELSNSPRHLIKGNLSIPVWQRKVFGSVELQYTSAAKTTPGRATRRAGEFWLANITLFSRELLPHLDLSASLYNVFDRKYAHPVGDDFIPDVIEQDGRTFRVKLTYRF